MSRRYMRRRCEEEAQGDVGGLASKRTARVQMNKKHTTMGNS